MVYAEANEVEGDSRATIGLANSETLQFDEARKKARPQTPGRFVAKQSDELSRAEVVAVEFFCEGAILFSDIDRRSNGIHH